MKRIATGSALIVALLTLVACSDDSSPATDSGGVDHSTVDLGLDGSIPDGPITDGPLSDGPASDGPQAAEAGADMASDAAAVMVTVSGKVEDGSTEAPIAGAKVYEVGSSPQNSTTSDAQGNYTLTVPKGHVTLRAEKAGYVSAQKVIDAKAGFSTGLPLVPPSFVASLCTQAGLPTVDTSKGVVAVDLSKAAVGQGASLSAANGGSMVLDSSDKAVKSSTILTTNNTLMIWVNVAPGTTTITYSPATKCSDPAGATSYPVNANVLTVIDAVCTP